MKPGYTLNDRDLVRLVDAADWELRAAVLFAACAGLRFEEMIGLNWQDIRWDDQRLRVRSRNGCSRHIPIHPALERALKLCHDARDGSPEVFERSCADVRLKRKLSSAFEVLGMRTVSFEDLRLSAGKILDETTRADALYRAVRSSPMPKAKRGGRVIAVCATLREAK